MLIVDQAQLEMSVLLRLIKFCMLKAFLLKIAPRTRLLHIHT